MTREELLETFGAAGKVVDAKVPTDRETGRPRGFAFVEFETEDAVRNCIATLNGVSLRGRSLRVSEAEDRPPRPAGGPRPFRPSEPSGFRGGPPPEAAIPEYRETRRKPFGAKGGKPGKPFMKEKGPRRTERRRGGGRAFDEDDY